MHARVIKIWNSSVLIAMQRDEDTRYRQGFDMPRGTSPLVRGRVNATHVDVPTLLLLPSRDLS